MTPAARRRAATSTSPRRARSWSSAQSASAALAWPAPSWIRHGGDRGASVGVAPSERARLAEQTEGGGRRAVHAGESDELGELGALHGFARGEELGEAPPTARVRPALGEPHAPRGRDAGRAGHLVQASKRLREGRSTRDDRVRAPERLRARDAPLGGGRGRPVGPAPGRATGPARRLFTFGVPTRGRARRARGTRARHRPTRAVRERRRNDPRRRRGSPSRSSRLRAVPIVQPTRG